MNDKLIIIEKICNTYINENNVLNYRKCFTYIDEFKQKLEGTKK